MAKKYKFGSVFQENVKKGSAKHHHFDSGQSGSWQESLMGGIENLSQTSLTTPWRRIGLAIFLIIIFSALVSRLFNLQVVEGQKNLELADNNRIKEIVIHAPRGVIYDRKGRILAQNEPSFRLVESSGSSKKITYISRDQELQMEVSNDTKLANLEIDNKRSYPYGIITAPILGYMGAMTEEEAKSPDFKDYQSGDLVGRSGLEETYEKYLRGVDGYQVIEVDAQGRKVRTLREVPPIPGHNLVLSLDIDMQKVAFQQVEIQSKNVSSCCGAALAQNPQTGEILALVSYPSFDPSNITDALTAANSPMLNRAISGAYPPGSTFKIITSLAGLSSGKITASTQFEDTGILKLGPYSFANWFYTQYGRTDGSVNVVKALQRSNDIYYYRLGALIGEESIADAARKLGLAEDLGIDIPGESLGVIPDANWKLKNIGTEWYPGDTLHMAIGQGYVTTTPLQISYMMSTIAADGKEYPPHFVLRITDPDGKTIKNFKYDSIIRDPFKLSDIQVVKQGLNLVTKTGGTAFPFFNFPIPTAGKTGTAEYGDPKNKTHAWYTSYAPADNPEIEITTLIEGGGEGSVVASPIAKEMYRYYFSQDKNNLIKDLKPQVATSSAKQMGE